jgi:glycosyltransferase involved in cell wall biosynthesis
MLKFSLGVADVHWLSLKPAVEGLIVPSKFYAIAAAGRPIIAICSKDGEIARRIRQHRCGDVVAPGDIEALVKAILRVAAESALVAAMGRRTRHAGCRFLASPGATKVAQRAAVYRANSLTFPKPFGSGSRAESDPYPHRCTCGLP